MLSELSIENFAIIDRLHLRFAPGFTVLTGETGAGKSIIVDAVQTVLGSRAGADLVRSSAPLAAVEAVFDWPDDDAAAAVLDEYGVEDEGCLILRREITSSGRSTARLNGRAVPLSVLSAVGALLVDIHGQSEHLSVLRRDRQLDALDRYGGLLGLRAELAAAVKEYATLRRQLEELTGGQRSAEQRLDLLRFQVQEIEGAQLAEGEEEELEAERNLLVNAERRTQLSGAAYEALDGESGAAADRLAEAASALRELAGIDESMADGAERLETIRFEVEDLAQEARRYRDLVEYDPRRLDAIEERLDLIVRLKRKYGSTVAEILAFGQRARTEMEEVENLDDRVAALRQQLSEQEARTGRLAEELSSSRREAAHALDQAMAEALQGLGLKGTDFQVNLSRTESADGLPVPSGGRFAFNQSGIDQATFLVSFNPGEPVRPLDRVASGGETSRFLLALKSVLAGADRTPTLIFDEVDVGVGGRGGAVVGERLRRLAESHQVISITHLPQVAALAQTHVTVAKATDGERTTVQVRELAGSDRVLELAEMMSGMGTEAARRNAEELLEAARRRAVSGEPSRP